MALALHPFDSRIEREAVRSVPRCLATAFAHSSPALSTRRSIV
jgi:hypothetical protein